MAHGLSLMLKELGEKLKPRPYVPRVPKICKGCGYSERHHRKIKKGRSRKIVCTRCGFVALSWEVGPKLRWRMPESETEKD